MDYSTERTSDFSRSLNNQAKLGAYYTDVEHCMALQKFLSFPDEEVICLEPSIGDGKAIEACINKTEGDKKKIFGVELNGKTAEETKTDNLIEQVLCADFLHGTTISPSSFSFVFSNPPYMTEDGLRMEELFFDKFHNLLKPGGVLVFVIPYHVFTSKFFFAKLYNRYHFNHVFRFHKQEYEKWHQIVLIGTKREQKENILRDERDRLLNEVYAEDTIPELPFDYEGERVLVPPSKEEGLKTFTTVLFPYEDCLKAMTSGTLKPAVDSFFTDMFRKIVPESYEGGKEKTCPIHPNKDSMYLLGVTGAGSGRCGSEEEGNLHLQRGVVKMVAKDDYQEDEKGRGTVVETTRASVTYKVIESNGMIRSLS